MEWELKVQKLWSPWGRRTGLGTSIFVVSRAVFVPRDRSRAVLPADSFLAISHINWHPLSNEYPHLFTAPAHPSLLNTLFLQPRLPSSQPWCLLTLVLFFWPPLTTGTSPSPLQLLGFSHKGKAPYFLARYRYCTYWILWKNAVLTCLPSLN